MIENWEDFAHSTNGVLIGSAAMFLLVVALMFATGEWSVDTGGNSAADCGQTDGSK